jgi:opacity protein-like surface antigen
MKKRLVLLVVAVVLSVSASLPAVAQPRRDPSGGGFFATLARLVRSIVPHTLDDVVLPKP